MDTAVKECCSLARFPATDVRLGELGWASDSFNMCADSVAQQKPKILSDHPFITSITVSPGFSRERDLARSRAFPGSQKPYPLELCNLLILCR